MKIKATILEEKNFEVSYIRQYNCWLLFFMTNLSDIILILGGWTVVVTGIIAFIGKNLINKLQIEWERNSKEQLQALKGEIDRKNNLISQLLTTHSTSFDIANKKKIDFLDNFWKLTVQLREENYETEFLYSFLLEDEMRKLYADNSIGSKTVREQHLSRIALNHSELSKKANTLKGEINRQRPFIGEKLFNLFINYMTFSLRTTYLLIKDAKNQKCHVWKDEASLVNILEESLDKKEIEYLLTREFGSYTAVVSMLETKMINEISYSLNGEEAVENSIKQAERLEKLMKLKTE
jgi:hypothetical protein